MHTSNAGVVYEVMSEGGEIERRGHAKVKIPVTILEDVTIDSHKLHGWYPSFAPRHTRNTLSVIANLDVCEKAIDQRSLVFFVEYGEGAGEFGLE